MRSSINSISIDSISIDSISIDSISINSASFLNTALKNFLASAYPKISAETNMFFLLQHRIAGIYHKLVLKNSDDALLLKAQKLEAARYLHHASALHKIVPCLEAAKIPFVVMRGASLWELYSKYSLIRPSVDVDILVAPHSIETLLELSDQPCSYKLLKSQASLNIKIADVNVDVHISYVEPYISRFSADGALERSIKISPITNLTIPVLAAKDQFISLLLHGSKHLWSRYIWLFDMFLFLEAHHQEIDELLSDKNIFHFIMPEMKLLKGLFYELSLPFSLKTKIDIDFSTQYLAKQLLKRMHKMEEESVLMPRNIIQHSILFSKSPKRLANYLIGRTFSLSPIDSCQANILGYRGRFKRLGSSFLFRTRDCLSR